MEKTWLSGKETPLGGSPERSERSEGLPPSGRPAREGAEQGTQPPDPQVLEKPTRRRFDRDYKLRILREVDQCTAPGQLGALLRREGLYSSHLNTWRQQRDQGILEALTPKKRGRQRAPHDPLVEEIQRLRRENERLTARLRQAETIIEIQKKASEILGIPLNSLDNGEPE